VPFSSIRKEKRGLLGRARPRAKSFFQGGPAWLSLQLPGAQMIPDSLTISVLLNLLAICVYLTDQKGLIGRAWRTFGPLATGGNEERRASQDSRLG